MKVSLDKGNGNRQFGTDFMEHLAVLLIALKFCGVISWPWWLVLFPLWIGGVLLGVTVILIWILEKRYR